MEQRLESLCNDTYFAMALVMKNKRRKILRRILTFELILLQIMSKYEKKLVFIGYLNKSNKKINEIKNNLKNFKLNDNSSRNYPNVNFNTNLFQ